MENIHHVDVRELYSNVQTMYEVAKYGKKLCNEGKKEEVQELLKDMNVVVGMIEAILALDEGHLLPLAIACCKNMLYSIEQFLQNPEKRCRIYNLEIMNMAQNIKDIVIKQYDIMNNKNDIQGNRDKILNRAIRMHDMVEQNKKKKFKYKVSIVLVGYNKLKYTKAAVESIYKYTDFAKGDIELITVNNGSSDGTREYFETLPNEKKINYKYNILGASLLTEIYEGEYVVGFSNDVVATPNWLDNLLACIESDKNIITVVPTCQDYAISCEQGIKVDYENTFDDLNKMEEFAIGYNKTNPCLWEERPILMPFVNLSRRELMEVDLIDSSYTQGQFIDDDISTVYRRSGWKQILAKDTFMHHFGSVTLGDNKNAANMNAFVNMRKVYCDKWGIDPWGSRGQLSCCKVAFDCCTQQSKDKILWIDPLFGYDFLNLKNRYKKDNLEIRLAKAIVTNAKYQKDAEAYFSEVIVDRDIANALINDHNKYNIIAMSRYINEILNSNLMENMVVLYKHLARGGYLLLPVKNLSSATNIYNFVSMGDSNKVYFDIENYNKVNVEQFINRLKLEIPNISYKVIKVQNNIELVDKIASLIENMGLSVTENVYDTLRMEMAWILIRA